MTDCDNNIDACYEFVYIMMYVCSDVSVALYMKILMYGSRKVGFAVFQKKGFFCMCFIIYITLLRKRGSRGSSSCS